MAIESLIAVYGCPVVFIGTFLEGESVILVGGLLALNGYIGYPELAFAAVSGAFAGDMVFFLLGQRSERLPWGRGKRWRRAVERANRLLIRHQRLTLMGYRFVYGLRGVIPFLLGAGGFPWMRFATFSALGAVLWTGVNLAAVFSLGRFMFSNDAMVRLFQSIGLVLLFLLVMGVFDWQRCRTRRKPLNKCH